MPTIKIIDDDRELADNLAVMLQANGYTTSVRTEYHGAIDDLVQNTPDLLILDVMFPENWTGGFDLARQIRKTSEIRNLPIILLTNMNQELPGDFSSDDIDDEWMPVQEFHEKPVDIEKLLPTIKELLAK
jgi:DNA-binding response OmpR family regulator